jgi:hypothetical protein
MQAAKKLLLVDEFNSEYKRLQRPADSVAKTKQSLKVSGTLRNRQIPDDKKAREYIAALHRYINLRSEVPEEPDVQINSMTEPVVRKSRRSKKKSQRWESY